MEVVAFHFDPAEPLQKNPNASTETLTDLVARRIVQGFTTPSLMPQHYNFLEQKKYPLPLAGERPTYAANLVISSRSAWLEMNRVKESAVNRRSHVVVSREGQQLRGRRGIYVIEEPQDDQVTGLGIGRRRDGNFDIEWYLCRVGRLT